MSLKFAVEVMISGALLGGSLAAPRALAQSYETEALYCMPYCQDRAINGMCVAYGPDFCSPYAQARCIPHCDEREINGMCVGYSGDFCGVYPECQPYCDERSITGMCVSYGQDVCISY